MTYNVFSETLNTTQSVTTCTICIYIYLYCVQVDPCGLCVSSGELQCDLEEMTLNLSDRDNVCENLRLEVTELQTQLDHLRRDKDQVHEENSALADKVSPDFWTYF